jgi:hypothetical protein
MLKRIHIIVFALICSNINAADRPMTRQEKIELQQQRLQFATNVVQQLNTDLYIDIKNAGNSSIEFDVPRSVKKIEFNGENLGNASICFYMAHTPADMKENIINKQNASISTFHPMRKYTAHIIGLSALTIGATIGLLILKKE